MHVRPKRVHLHSLPVGGCFAWPAQAQEESWVHGIRQRGGEHPGVHCLHSVVLRLVGHIFGEDDILLVVDATAAREAALPLCCALQLAATVRGEQPCGLHVPIVVLSVALAVVFQIELLQCGLNVVLQYNRLVVVDVLQEQKHPQRKTKAEYNKREDGDSGVRPVASPINETLHRAVLDQPIGRLELQALSKVDLLTPEDLEHGGADAWVHEHDQKHHDQVYRLLGPLVYGPHSFVRCVSHPSICPADAHVSG
mmetsp:Transcript_39355/g.85613  ORF Transcript_39355/g.85613 Transcript_39355/m.85613 type:complete len:253 (-) Transcript_39355:645-1403(-)